MKISYFHNISETYIIKESKKDWHYWCQLALVKSWVYEKPPSRFYKDLSSTSKNKNIIHNKN